MISLPRASAGMLLCPASSRVVSLPVLVQQPHDLIVPGYEIGGELEGYKPIEVAQSYRPRD